MYQQIGYVASIEVNSSSSMQLMHPNYVVCECVCVCVCVGSYLSTEAFIGNLPATGRGWIIVK